MMAANTHSMFAEQTNDAIEDLVKGLDVSGAKQFLSVVNKPAHHNEQELRRRLREALAAAIKMEFRLTENGAKTLTSLGLKLGLSRPLCWEGELLASVLPKYSFLCTPVDSVGSDFEGCDFEKSETHASLAVRRAL